MGKLSRSLGPSNAALVGLLESSEQEFIRQLHAVGVCVVTPVPLRLYTSRVRSNMLLHTCMQMPGE
jgi:hypothetical protein